MKNKNSVLLGKVSNDITPSLKEDELLLLQAPTEDLSILRTLNLDHKINELNNKKYQIDVITAFKNKFKSRNVVKGSDIKKLCNLYDLKMCSTRYFLVETDLNLINAIKEFEKEYSYEVQKNDERTIIKSEINISDRNFFILAPSENFLDAKSKLKNATLFYREFDGNRNADENDLFIELYSWGDNYNDLRMFNVLFNNYNYHIENEFSYSNQIPISLLLSLIFILFTSVYNGIIINLTLQIIMFLSTLIPLLYFKNLTHFTSWNKPEFKK